MDMIRVLFYIDCTTYEYVSIVLEGGSGGHVMQTRKGPDRDAPKIVPGKIFSRDTRVVAPDVLATISAFLKNVLGLLATSLLF